VHADLGTALVMINLGVFYIAQNADFLGSVQVFVYTGAVMMLLLFVVMLVGVDSSNSLVETIKGPDKGLHRWLPAVISVPLAAHLRQASHAPSNGSGNRRGSASSSAVTDSGS
jgi:NADH-quinone oxidoreductase subunit J